jgi:hypothetical protein
VRRRRSRVPWQRIVPLTAGLAVVVWALALSEPERQPDQTNSPVAVVPSWNGPATVDLPGVLDDGSSYEPRLFLDPATSVGVATTTDGAVRVIMAKAPGSFTALHSRPAADHAQVNGFAVDGDTLVWMESTARGGSATTTALWRANLKSTRSPVQVTTNTGDVNFSGLATDVVIRDGRVTWTSVGSDEPARTQVRSVPVGGGQVGIRPLTGEFLLTTPPWAVSVPAGPGSPVTLQNLDTDKRVNVTTVAGEAATCDPTWCRVTVAGDAGLVGIDLMHPDGSGRVRVAGPEATPTIGDATLLDRYVPLAVDRADGVGLSLYDVSTGRTQLVAQRAANVGGRGAILWWSTGVGSGVVWHALDLSRV